PLKLRLWVSSTVDDADLFAVVRNIGPDGGEVTYPGVMPGRPTRVAVAYGWLRVSHRKLDPARSTPYRPFHTPDQLHKVPPATPAELQKVPPGTPVPVDIEIVPTATVFEAGHRLVLEVRASDDPHHTFTHSDPRDRIQRGSVTIHSGGSFDSHLLVPIIPPR